MSNEVEEAEIQGCNEEIVAPDDIHSCAQLEDEEDIESKDIAIDEKDRQDPDMPQECLTHRSQDVIQITERKLLKTDTIAPLKRKDIASAVTLPDLVTIEPKDQVVKGFEDINIDDNDYPANESS